MLRAEMRTGDTSVEFLVRTDEPAFRAVLPDMGYVEADGAFVRGFPAAGDAKPVFARFSRHLDAVLRQAARGERPAWEEALAAVADRLDAAPTEWFLCGSAALAVRGIDAEPRDVDLVVADYEATVGALADALIEPPLSVPEGWVARSFGRAYLGARVEWVGDVDPAVDSWEWPSELGPQAAARLEAVEWRGRTLRLAPLDLQLAVSESRGLGERVARIRAHRAYGT